jgi:hypothetical protein
VKGKKEFQVKHAEEAFLRRLDRCSNALPTGARAEIAIAATVVVFGIGAVIVSLLKTKVVHCKKHDGAIGFDDVSDKWMVSVDRQTVPRGTHRTVALR